jgi:hypothetical protein
MLTEDKVNSKDVIDYLKTITPSGIELEFISLATFELDSSKQLNDPNACLIKMLEVFIECLTRNQDVDFVQAMLNNFLTNHHEIITQEVELVQRVE